LSTELSAPSAPDVSSAVVTGGSTAADPSPAPTTTDTSSPDVHTGSSPNADQSVQGESTSTAPDDPLAGLPSEDELQAAVANKTPHAEALARLRSAYSEIKPKLEELTQKFTPFESLSERFQSAEELAPIIELNDALFGQYERDPQSGQLVPAVNQGVEMMFQRDPQRAGYFWAESAERSVPHPDTGQPVKLIDLALEGMRDDPSERQRALSILGGVEPSAQAPTWAPTTEQLAAVKPELQDTFRNLPYDEREDLSANTPEFINKYLSNQKFQQDLIEQNKQAQQLQVEQQRQRDQYERQQAEEAGNKYVEEQFRNGFTEYRNSIVERSQFIKPLDAQQAQELNLAPEQVAAYNQDAQQINEGIGTFIAFVSAATSHPDLQWMATDFLTKLGLDSKIFGSLDQARQEFAQNGRNYGELQYQKRDAGNVLTNANRAMSRLRGQSNLVASPLFGLFSKFFEMKANSYNATLKSAEQARPPVSGNGYDPTTAGLPRPTGWLTKEDYQRQFGG